MAADITDHFPRHDKLPVGARVGDGLEARCTIHGRARRCPEMPSDLVKTRKSAADATEPGETYAQEEGSTKETDCGVVAVVCAVGVKAGWKSPGRERGGDAVCLLAAIEERRERATRKRVNEYMHTGRKVAHRFASSDNKASSSDVPAVGEDDDEASPSCEVGARSWILSRKDQGMIASLSMAWLTPRSDLEVASGMAGTMGVVESEGRYLSLCLSPVVSLCRAELAVSLN